MNKCLSENFCSPSLHQAGNAAHGTYFPHIDGLRTFAVLAVVLYHLQEWICPGGYTGVDIFFVISGYLIGGGLVRSLKEGNFSLSSFYYRRIRRIMPAYFCLIAVVLAFVATLEVDGVENEIGVCRYAVNPDGESCEFAVVVADDWQHRGLARKLMGVLIETARSRGIQYMNGVFLANNERMLKFVQKLGFVLSNDPEDSSVKLGVLALQD